MPVRAFKKTSTYLHAINYFVFVASEKKNHVPYKSIKVHRLWKTIEWLLCCVQGSVA